MKSKYKITVELGEKVYKGRGSTALEAIQNLEKPLKVFNKGIVTWDNGIEKRSTVLMPVNVKRLWWKLAQPVLAKQFESGLLGLK